MATGQIRPTKTYIPGYIAALGVHINGIRKQGDTETTVQELELDFLSRYRHRYCGQCGSATKLGVNAQLFSGETAQQRLAHGKSALAKNVFGRLGTNISKLYECPKCPVLIAGILWCFDDCCRHHYYAKLMTFGQDWEECYTRFRDELSRKGFAWASNRCIISDTLVTSPPSIAQMRGLWDSMLGAVFIIDDLKEQD